MEITGLESGCSGERLSWIRGWWEKKELGKGRSSAIAWMVSPTSLGLLDPSGVVRLLSVLASVIDRLT